MNERYKTDWFRIFLMVALIISLGANHIYRETDEYISLKFREVKVGILDSVVGYECAVEFSE